MLFDIHNISNPLSSEAVGFAAAAFEFQNIPDPLSSEAVGIAAAATIEFQNIPDPLLYSPPPPEFWHSLRK